MKNNHMPPFFTGSVQRHFIVRVALAFALILIFSMPALAARDYFKVGVITSLSGDYASGGALTKQGYDTWARVVNDKGGIDIDGKKYRVKLVYADAKSNPKSSADAMAHMIQREHVDFVLGPYSSAVTLAAAPIAEKYQVPMITGSAESPEIWKHHFQFTFGTVPSVDLTSASPIKFLAKNTPAKSIAIIGSNDPFSKNTAKGFKVEAEKDNLDVLSYDIVPPKSDFTTLLNKTKLNKPDILAVGGEPGDLINILKAMNPIKFSPKAIVMHYGVTYTKFIDDMGNTYGNYTIGIINGISNKNDPLFGSSKHYEKLFKEHYGFKPSDTAKTSSVTGEAFAKALQEINTTPPLSRSDQVNLVKSLENIKIHTFIGEIAFAKEGDHYHDNTKLEHTIAQIIDGKLEIVFPQKYKTHDLVYPRPSFSDIMK